MNETTEQAPPAFSLACKLLGTQADVSRELGVNPSFVNQMCSGHRPVPDEVCVAMERLSRGFYACEVLNPNLNWLRIPDPTYQWHPNGRPVIDPSPKPTPTQAQG